MSFVKPLSVTVELGKELVAIAQERGLLCIANLMQRHNPLYQQVQELVLTELNGLVSLTLAAEANRLAGGV